MDIWEIVPGNLYQSGEIVDPSYLDLGIDTVVDLTSDPDQHLPDRREFMYVHWPIEDGPMPDEGTVRALARFIRDMLASGRKVLVHCGAGVNRSGMVNARVLIASGEPPARAIEIIRTRRPGALGNGNFLDWLNGENPG